LKHSNKKKERKGEKIKKEKKKDKKDNKSVGMATLGCFDPTHVTEVYFRDDGIVSYMKYGVFFEQNISSYI